MSDSPHTWRRRAGVALVVASMLVFSATAIVGYARSVLVDRGEFATRAGSALDDPDVRSVLADQVVGGLTGSVAPDVLVVRPLVVHAVAALAGTAPFRRLLMRAISDRHRALTDGEGSFSFQLPLGEGLVFESLRSVSPRVAGAIPPDLTAPVLRLDPRKFELAGARHLVALAGWWWPLLIASVLSAAGCALVAGNARGALVCIGTAAAGAGLLVAAAVTGLGELAVSHAAHSAELTDDAERGAVRALWAALFSDLRAAGLLAALGGAVVAALAAGELPTRRVDVWWQRVRGVAGSGKPAARLARGACLIVLGVGLVLAPALVGRILLVAGGGVIVLVGVSELSGRGRRARPAYERSGDASPLLLAGGVAAALILTVVAVALVLPAPSAAPVERAGSVRVCNGSRALCARRLNEVAFAGTHNSYAAAEEPGWLFANQRYGVARQLRDGIRAFLIDVHYGVRDASSGRVRTDLAGENSSRNKVVRQLSPRAVRTADRLAGRVGVARLSGERRPYLCHTLCELGAEPLDDQLQIIADFLKANRGEVVLLFVEPYVPVGAIERSLKATGLLAQAAEIRRDEPLPTLGELARADTRLVVLAEEDGGERPWYLPGFSFVQDTPLGATTPAQLRCGRYRGSRDSPLLLVNHWIPPFPPSVSRNGQIAGKFLSERLGRCERRRRLIPNLIAVDFYERSGVVEVVRRLNAGRQTP